jgi:hypothetical protein
MEATNYKCRFCEKELERSSICFPCSVSRRRFVLRQRALEYGGNKCQDCGYNECPDALHFHHLDPSTKEFSISSGNTKSWEKIVRELEKCILICANCHAKRHYIPPPDDYLEYFKISFKQIDPDYYVKYPRLKKIIEHGLIGKYKQGCRCDLCKSASTQYRKKFPRNMEKYRATQLSWLKNRRASWIQENGPCAQCSSIENLEVSYKDPSTKIYKLSSLWSLTESKRLPELAKCTVLCRSCRLIKTGEYLSIKNSVRPEDRLHDYNNYLKHECRCSLCIEDHSRWRKWRRSEDREGSYPEYKASLCS